MQINMVTGLVPVLVAVTGAGGAPSVTESELLARLDGASAAVVLSGRHLSRAQADLVAARTFEDPQLEITRENPSGPSAETSWALSWQFPESRRRLDISAAEKSVLAAKARGEEERRELRAALRADFARWAVASLRRSLLEEETNRLEALASRERTRAEKGEASGLDARRLELAQTALRARLAQAAGNEARARAEVVRWWPSLDPTAHPELPGLAPMAVHGEGGEASENEHPRLVATRWHAEAAELSRQAAEKRFSSPELTLGWMRVEALAGEVDGPVFGLAWSVPLSGRRRAARLEAQNRLDSARARAELARQEIAARRAASVSAYADLLRRTGEAKAALEGSDEVLRGAEKSFHYGELTLTDLLEIGRSVTEAHLAWLELYGAALAAERELEALTTPPPAMSSPHPDQEDEQ